MIGGIVAVVIAIFIVLLIIASALRPRRQEETGTLSYSESEEPMPLNEVDAFGERVSLLSQENPVAPPLVTDNDSSGGDNVAI
jgi:hypothetical protein